MVSVLWAGRRLKLTVPQEWQMSSATFTIRE
jgi:hypothetical protein